MATFGTGLHLTSEAALHKSSSGKASAFHATDFTRFKLECPPFPVDSSVNVFSPDGIIASLIADLPCM
jgi:hypothetical protein